MYLKKIEIFGFKSFAEKTEIVFERGVTCVVGPNGCGKSNISDSIRWVLGERSAKLLRGSKMEDVIFSGTEFKKPLNLAEVSLVIDNTNQKLPIQYEEVVITRRLHRSGESEYLLNRTPCRLKDIQDLILDTGIGSNSYSMIEQGRIDYILNAEAEERRFLIEEAAGISKYKVKKEEALRKLERTEQNLLRLNDITSEVERNIRYAERQAQRAERYKEQFERLKTLEIKKAFFEISRLKEQLNVLNQDREEQQKSLEVLEERANTSNFSARNIEERLQKLEASFFEQESARSESKQQLSAVESQERFHHEKIEFLKLAAGKALGEIEALTKRCDSLTVEITAKEKQRAELSTLIIELQSKKNDSESRLSNLGNKSAFEEELNQQQSILFGSAHQMSELRNCLHQVQGEMVACERTKANLVGSHQKLSETKTIYLLRHETINEERTGYEEKQSQIEEDLIREVKNHQELENSAEELKSKLTQIKTRKIQLEGNIRLLEEFNQATGSDPKRIAAQHDLSAKGVTKAFLDLIQIVPGYELAVEAGLSGSLNAVVTDSLKTASDLLNCLKKSEIRQGIILIKDQMLSQRLLGQTNKIESNSAIKKSLFEVVQVADEYADMLRVLMENIYVIDELTPENIFEIAPYAKNHKLVTKKGNTFGPNFRIILRNKGYTPEQSALARGDEQVKLAQELNQIIHQEIEIVQLIEQNDIQLRELKNREQLLNRGALELQSSLMQREGTLTSVSEYVKEIDDEINLTLQEIKASEAEISRLSNQRQTMTDQIEQLETHETKEKEFLQLIEERIKSQQISRNEVESQLFQFNSNIVLTHEKSAALLKTIEFLADQLKENTTYISNLNDDRKKSFVQIEQLQIELNDLASKKELATKQLFEQSVLAEQLRRERAEILVLRNQALENAQVTAKELEGLRQKFHHFSLQEMELNHQNEFIIQNLQSRYKITLAVLNPADYAIMEEELEEEKTEIEKLREKLEAIGTVNLLAIDEYQELKERYDLLLSQKTDLTQSKESLLEAIRKINRTTKKLFEETLVRVRESFREYYRTLFGGGFADLVLIDEQNPFESGLDIVARPPGKKLQHITLLSGGEKALTAIALLLALFSVKPSPFCVLDEVDAPLDESNNDRFIHVLKPFLETTQFIIVTHSRKTIAMGDALYGVTMQEPGVSKLVSVRLSQDNDSIEHSDTKVATELNQILN